MVDSRYPAELLEAAEALTKLVAADEDFEETMAATADICYKIDAIQVETGEGPCMSSIKDHATFRIPDMAQDHTWPNFSKRAAEETGIQSMLSFVLRLSDEDTGAMNLLSTKKDAFSQNDIDKWTKRARSRSS